MKKDLDSAALLKMLMGIRSQEVDTPAKGYYTHSQYAKKWGCSVSHAKKLIACGLRAGKIKTAVYRVKVEKIVRKTVHYCATQ